MYKKSYLSPQSQEWGRALEASIDEYSEFSRLDRVNSENDLKQIGSSVSLMNKNKNNLVLQQTSLEAQQIQLESQQIQLEGQQKYLESFKTYYIFNPSMVSTTNTSGQVTLGDLRSTAISTGRTGQITVRIESSADLYSTVTDFPGGNPLNFQSTYPNTNSYSSLADLWAGAPLGYTEEESEALQIIDVAGTTWWIPATITRNAVVGKTHIAKFNGGTIPPIRAIWQVWMNCHSGYTSLSNRTLTISVIG
jgi:hypothetical protein